MGCEPGFTIQQADYFLSYISIYLHLESRCSNIRRVFDFYVSELHASSTYVYTYIRIYVRIIIYILL